MFRLGFDIGGTSLKLGLVRLEKDKSACPELVKLLKRPFPRGKDPEVTVKAMVEMVQEISKGLHIDQIQTMGIAVAGSIDEKAGLVINAHNLGFHNMPLLDRMKSHFPDFKMALANDADAACLGELKAGALKGVKTGILLTLGTGVGGGIVLDGKLFKGGMGRGNELGHMTLKHGGPLCTCGNRGCIESLCSASWLISASQEPTAKDLIDKAKVGQAKALEIFQEYLDYLSSALASLAVFLDPEVMVLGGGVAEAGDYLFDPLRDMVEEKSFFRVHHRIIPAQLGKDAGVIGASYLLD